MSSHDELVMEMATLEKMSVQERLKHARKRRAQQLKRYHQSDKEFTKRQRKNTNQMSQGQQMKRHVTFAPNVELLEAAARGDIDEVRYKLENGVDPNIGNEDGLTALHQSCIDNNEGMMRVLVEKGADVNVTDRELWTPLHAASTCGHKHLAQFLISRGAQLLAINSDGNMPYDICEDEATLDYIESQMAAQGITQDQIDELREVLPNEMLRDLQELYKNGGDLEYKDSVGATALHIAVANGYDKVVQYLLSHNVDVSAKDNDGWRPIHAAVCWAQADIIQMLVEAGADLDARTNNDETPLSICEDEEIRSLIQQLKTEIQSNRIKPSNLVRRSSSRNKRGSSIRRSSKREKGEMRKLDARGEAAYIQSKSEELEKSDELPATNIDDVPVGEETNGEVDKSEEKEESELENGEDGRVTPMPVITEELSDHPESPRNKKMTNNGDLGGDHGENEVQENGKTENGDVDNDSVDGGSPTIANQKRLVSILKKRTDDDNVLRTDKSKKDKKEDREKEKQKQKEKEKMERQRQKEEKAQKRKEEEQRKKEKKKSKYKSGGDTGSKDEQYFQDRAGGETLADLKQKRSSLNSQPGSPVDGPEGPDTDPTLANSDASITSNDSKTNRKLVSCRIC